MAFGFSNLINGLSGNLTEVPVEKLTQEYAAFLISNEKIQAGYTLIRDAVIFTNLRIIFIDKQGATGKKVNFKSIFLMNIINVEMETAGSGIDDSELIIYYLGNIKLKAHKEIIQSIKLEFPKRANIAPLYRKLMTLALDNRLKINS